jgi:hypothetical protein
MANPKKRIFFLRVLRLLLSPSCDGENVTLEEPYEMASPYRGIA